MLTGKLMGHGVATNPRGDQVAYQLIEPARTRENITEMAREMKRWSRIANILRGYKPAIMGGMDPLAKRASFAEDVIALTAEDVRLGQCCVLMAQAQDGRILGTVEYVVRRDEAGIELLAVDPTNLPGVSGDHGLRGIGTGIVAAISRRMVAAGSPLVTLIPFDREAKAFWQHRGFQDCNPPVMCVEGRASIDRLIGSCEVAGDCPDKDECVACGLEARAMMMRPPDVRAARANKISRYVKEWAQNADRVSYEVKWRTFGGHYEPVSLYGGFVNIIETLAPGMMVMARKLTLAGDIYYSVQNRNGIIVVYEVGQEPEAQPPEGEVRAWTAAQYAQMRLNYAREAVERYKLSYMQLPEAERMRRRGRYQFGLQPLEAEVDAARHHYLEMRR